MEKEVYRNYLRRLVVIDKDISRLEVEWLKRHYANREFFMEEIKRLQNEEAMIIDSLDCVELAFYYDDYKDELTKDELNALGRSLMQLIVRKNKERKGRS